MKNWISISDKLPKYGVAVLAFSDLRHVDVCFRGISETGDDVWANWMRPQYVLSSVTHWQRLPKLPIV